MSRIIERYLEHIGAMPLPVAPVRRYRYVLTIPAFDEPLDFLNACFAAETREDVLCIIIVNVPDHATTDQLARTRRLARQLKGLEQVVVIERLDQPIPRRQGVGLARKLGADLACALIGAGNIECPLIFMTDADAVLPAGYFAAAAQIDGPGTLIYPFEHTIRPDLEEADSQAAALQSRANLYELHLYHYVSGLLSARSPYAHQTLGSTIAIHAETYAAVRGMPTRNAAEDFYLLNKAAKVAPVFSLAEPRLSVGARYSTRVPFGTGPALARLPEDLEQFLSYPDGAFMELAEVLDALRDFGLEDQAVSLDPPLAEALAELDWHPERFSRQHPAGPNRWRSVLEWFDGFRTLRFVRMREKALPRARLLETLRNQPRFSRLEPAEMLACYRDHREIRITGVDPLVKTQSAQSL